MKGAIDIAPLDPVKAVDLLKECGRIVQTVTLFNREGAVIAVGEVGEWLKPTVC